MCPMFQEDQVDAASDAVKAEFDRLGKNWDFAKEAPWDFLVGCTSCVLVPPVDLHVVES